ncbi:casein kinase 2 substrate-domain-containing protein [Scenedesmus sp. NREL 46B-D3]|nr:casein kinase 2 substrate-domain-containing protein [Scenedesmus sp. NREL 46B-D3]
MSAAAVAAAVPQIAKAANLWTEWNDTHRACCQALSSAVNILERLEVLADGSLFASLSHQPEVQQQVVAKQLAALNKALALLHSHHEALKGTVRDLERLHIEALRSLSAAANLEAAAVFAGPQPTAVQCVEALQDMWLMCKSELLLKIAAAGLVTLDMSLADSVALMACYQSQPNVRPAKVDVVLALLKETAPTPNYG